jgi:hypothetical protein
VFPLTKTALRVTEVAGGCCATSSPNCVGADRAEPVQTIASGPNSMTVRAASVTLPDSDG